MRIANHEQYSYGGEDAIEMYEMESGDMAQWNLFLHCWIHYIMIT